MTFIEAARLGSWRNWKPAWKIPISKHLVRQVAGVTVGLQEQHLANAAIMNDFHRSRAIGIVAQLEAGLENSDLKASRAAGRRCDGRLAGTAPCQCRHHE